ncbi:MAG: hypothetical protein ACRDOK_09365 [Streptosporangiaceae bacterium]
MAASTSLTPEQRTLRARNAAFERWSREDPSAAARAGQAGLLAKFDREASSSWPQLTLPGARPVTRNAPARSRSVVVT